MRSFIDWIMLRYADIAMLINVNAVWLNRKTTYEVNVPGHEQCVVAHLERNASAALLKSIRKHGDFLPNIEEIKVLECLDPFEKHKEWK